MANAFIQRFIKNNFSRVSKFSYTKKFLFRDNSYRSSNTTTNNETSIIHTLTSWLPEPIPLK